MFLESAEMQRQAFDLKAAAKSEAVLERTKTQDNEYMRQALRRWDEQAAGGFLTSEEWRLHWRRYEAFRSALKLRGVPVGERPAVKRLQKEAWTPEAEHRAAEREAGIVSTTERTETTEAKA